MGNQACAPEKEYLNHSSPSIITFLLQLKALNPRWYSLWHWGIPLWIIWALPALATPELDRQYTLETVGFMRSWDKDGGLYSDAVGKAFIQAAKNFPRFRVIDLSLAETVWNHSKLPYLKIIQDPKLLAQLAKTTQAESLIRTRVVKKGTHYFFTLDWLHFPKGEQLGNLQFTIDLPDLATPFTLERIAMPIEDHLKQLFLQVPFLGQVIGLEEKRAIVNLGKTQFLNPGDTLTIGTLQEVKRHPLLNKILGWRLQPTAELMVEQVDASLAFCQVKQIQMGQSPLKYQKVLQIQHKKN